MNFFTTLNIPDLLGSLKWFRSIRGELLALIEESDVPYPMEVRFIHALHGSIKPSDAYILKALLEKHRTRTILEVGSFLGLSTRWLLETTSPWDARVTSVDPNIRHRIYDNPRRFLEKLNADFVPGRLEIKTAFFGNYDEGVYEDYEAFEPRLERREVDGILNSIDKIDGTWNRKFDFIFIDGNHSYRSVMDNFRNALALLGAGGSIAFHDPLTWEGVYKALEELKTSYAGRAEVTIHGRVDKFVLRYLMNLANDGIGLFTLKNT